MNERNENAFDAKLRQALDISTPELTPDPSTLSDLKSRIKSRGSIGHVLSRNAFLPAPVGSFGAIAAAAVLTLFVLTGTGRLPANTESSDVYVAAIDTSRSIDSITMHTQFSLADAADSLLYRVSPDSLSQ
jgi:hypothetical protein